MSKWRPIKSAPKDGSWLDIWATTPLTDIDISGWRFAYCRWKEPTPFWDGGWEGVNEGWTPSHWMRPPVGPS